MKIELVQLAGRDGDTAYNLSRTLNAIATCAGDTDLLVFPETYLSGFVGGAVAGVAGMMLVLPVLGVVMVIGENIGVIVADP